MPVNAIHRLPGVVDQVSVYYIYYYVCCKLFDFIMSEPAHAPKRISVVAQVSGSFGKLFCNPNPAIKHKHKCRIFGNVVEAIDNKRYKVMFDNSAILQCYSNNLHVELPTAF